ncbi:MAG: hypothetical protein K6F32_00875 [Bacilli bacterium]|nr:hypothetical protein [Bacilli bacterium]
MLEEVLQFLKDYWPLLGGGILLLGLLVTVTVTYIVSQRSYDAYKKQIDEQTSSIRVFVIDIPNNMVKYFNATTLTKSQNMTLGDFYAQFPMSEQKKVINWINAVADPNDDAPDVFETDVQVSRGRKQYFSLLQVDSVDKKRGVIHLESYLLKYMSSARSSNGTHGLSTAKDLAAALNANGRRKGTSACFRFAYRRIQDKDKVIDQLIFNQLKNCLAPFIDSKHLLIQCSQNELLLCDLKINERAKSLYFVKSALNSINRYLALNGYSSLIDVRVGVVEHRFYSGEVDGIIEQVRKTAQIAFDDNEQILWYQKGRESLSPLNDASYRTEVERIINEKKLSYFFRPVYNAKSKKVFGYFTKAEPRDTYFDSIEELKDYASRTDDASALFSTIARNTLPIFVNERTDEDAILFYPVRTEERGYMLLTFAKLAKAKQAHVVFLFSESDVKSHFDSANSDAIIDDMRSIKAKGYEVGLYFNEGELTLPPVVYTAYDYFVCSFAFAGSANEMDARIRSQLHGLVEKLLKYDKPIIATDIEGWASIELLVRSGVTLISSEAFAPFDQMILPLPPKSIRRVADMRK